MPTGRGYGRDRAILKYRKFLQPILDVNPGALVALWPLQERSGTVADDITATGADGAYTGGFTLGENGLTPVGKSVLINGSTGRVSLTGALAALNGVGKFNGAEGSAGIWCKIPVATPWTDGSTDVAFEFGVDANNRVFAQKSSNNNELLFSYRAGGTVETIQYSFVSLDWFRILLTWSKAAEEFKAYVNGVQAGATQTALGTFVGSLLNTFTGIGDFRSSASSTPWNGLLAYPALWNAPLNAAQARYESGYT